MVKKIKHRGPDDQGVFVDGNIGLGHTRLSIIDLSERGHQPMADAEKNLWITFNGEIYNFQQLRQELKRDGIQFSSKTDTEVIIYLYKKYGVDCVKKMRGMFAFAIWDTTLKRLFIARDRAGQKPLKYFHDGSRFIFASELKAILADSTVPKEIDWGAIDEFLTFQYIPSPKTGFEHIFKLEPAHYLLIDEHGNLKKHCYWEYRYQPKIELNEQEIKQKVKDTLEEAVRLRLISDVPLGAHLSGGIDSSVIVALMAKLTDKPVKTFSIGFAEQKFNELPYARMVANQYKTDHHEFIVQPDAISLMGKLAYQYEEPFADPAALPTWYLSKMTREHVTVALNGDGGDENFAGYSRYTAMQDIEQIRPILKLIPFKKFVSKISWQLWKITKQKKFRQLSQVLSYNLADPMSFYREMIGYFKQKDKKLIYDKKVCERIQNSRYATLLPKFFNDSKKLNFVDRLLYVDNQTYLPDDLLVKVDIASMAHALEVRSPFLDHEFMELTARLPVDLKIRSKNKKYLLKQIAYDLLPKELIDRPKQGFGVPFETWFKTSLYEYLKEQLLDEKFIGYGFSAVGIKKMIEDHRQEKAIYTNQLWALLNLRWWLRTWFE